MLDLRKFIDNKITEYMSGYTKSLPAIPVSEIIKLGENEYGTDNMLEEFEAIEKEGFIKLNKGSDLYFLTDKGKQKYITDL